MKFAIEFNDIDRVGHDKWLPYRHKDTGSVAVYPARDAARVAIRNLVAKMNWTRDKLRITPVSEIKAASLRRR